MDTYEQAMNEGHDYAWGNRWLQAADAYGRALRVRPDDIQAQSNLALALYQAGRYQDALHAYLRVAELQPGDTTTLSKIAEIYMAVRDIPAAVSTLLLLADRYIETRQPALAVKTWQQVIRFDRRNKAALRKLAEAYRRGKRPDIAAQVLVELARVHQSEGRVDQAIACCEQALALAPDHAPAQTLLAQLPGAPPRLVEPGAASARPARGTGATGGPTEQAAKLALSRLAAAFFDGASPENLKVEALKAQALDYQTHGLVEEAIHTYEAIVASGHAPPEVIYNLGVLYQDTLRFDDAIHTLEGVRAHPDYALAATLSIGQCYQQKGRNDDAQRYYMEAIKIVDLHTVERDQADNLIRLYEGLADSYTAQGNPAEAEQFTATLNEFFSDRGWEDKLHAMRQRAGGVAAAGEAVTLAELLEDPGNEAALAAMAAVDQYIQQGLFATALEECYWGIGLDPHYLPLHLRLVDLFAAQQRVDEAVGKLITVGEVYAMRGRAPQAIRTLERALELAPLDQNVRHRLIDLLMKHGEIDRALEHSVALADIFYQLAQTDRAIERLTEAARLAPRGSTEKRWQAVIQKRLAEIHIQRLDWRRALAALDTARTLAPDDRDIGQTLVDLYYQIGDEQRARETLEELSERAVAAGDGQAVLDLWRTYVERRPEDFELRRQYGERCAVIGHVEEACIAWTPLVDHYLAVEQAAQAAALLRRMIALKPVNEAQYRARLQELVRAAR